MRRGRGASRPEGPRNPTQPLKNHLTFSLLKRIEVPVLLIAGESVLQRLWPDFLPEPGHCLSEISEAAQQHLIAEAPGDQIRNAYSSFRRGMFLGSSGGGTDFIKA